MILIFLILVLASFQICSKMYQLPSINAEIFIQMFYSISLAWLSLQVWLIIDIFLRKELS
jgi:hypothetical protein